jgi:excisionase family DNA binding protein
MMDTAEVNWSVMAINENEKLLIRISEAAEMLSVARSKAYAMVQAGELPAVRMGKSVRVSVRALNEYVERKMAEALSA